MRKSSNAIEKSSNGSGNDTDETLPSNSCRKLGLTSRNSNDEKNTAKGVKQEAHS